MPDFGEQLGPTIGCWLWSRRANAHWSRPLPWALRRLTGPRAGEDASAALACRLLPGRKIRGRANATAKSPAARALASALRGAVGILGKARLHERHRGGSRCQQRAQGRRADDLHRDVAASQTDLRIAQAAPHLDGAADCESEILGLSLQHQVQSLFAEIDLPLADQYRVRGIDQQGLQPGHPVYDGGIEYRTAQHDPLVTGNQHPQGVASIQAQRLDQQMTDFAGIHCQHDTALSSSSDSASRVSSAG